jgi:LAO/AO transport system kinase
MTLVEAVLNGERLALARLLTQVENDTPAGRAALNDLFHHTGQAHLIGITGSPGTGKSSLVNHLARALRADSNQQVAIIAVDPSSPFTGGALLGDRVRMRDLAGDPGVFIRSMAARGALGGLAHSTAAAAQVLDAAGFHFILIETVGAGQSEVDIARLAHTTIVVEAPGMGDDIQAIKAGILEIADILVVNKADRPGVENTERALRAMLELANPGRKGSGEQVWKPPVLRTVASQGQGMPDLVSAISKHVEYLHESGTWQTRERERIQNNLTSLLQSSLVERWQSRVAPERYQQVLQRLYQREISPFQAVEQLINL